ncbi:hypothetical protein [Glaesserella parasuis]|uniref:hypothetical protein n=1 Tax=Glaesserella parasuis TaxID=738 RepID=UPI0005B4836D|nr:hypothetical protein [Glaesserella parasuis]
MADIEANGSLSIEVDKKEGFEFENAELIQVANGYYQVRFKGQSLVSVSQEKGIPFSITCINTTFWGIRGNFEMDESRYWKG